MKAKAFVAGVLVGGGVMYMMDPEKGPRRRALARRASSKLQQRTKAVTSTLVAKSQDLLAIEKVISYAGHALRHPESLEVDAKDGRIVLKGSIQADEVSPLLKHVSSIRGVLRVDNRLEIQQGTEGSVN